MKHKKVLQFMAILFVLSGYAFCQAVDYHVGPGQPLAAIGDVHWETLNAGDAVYIHYRSEFYKEKWVIGRSGTEQAPILVSGVPGPNGELPVISGEDATTRPTLDYTNQDRGLIKIGSSSRPPNTMPAYIIIENLDLRSAHQSNTFTDNEGVLDTYRGNAASIYVEKAQHLIIRNCIVQDSGNGIFVGAFDGDTQDILIEKNQIFGNGNVDSIYHHNTYTAAIGITYQYNYMGALRAGARGNNLKDRSAGLVVRYNWIENGNRQLDLVDAEDSINIVNDPAYGTTHVYGNVLIEGDGEGNSQMVHYGGDSTNQAIYRKGTLYFYNNTLMSWRNSNTTVVRLSTNDESADFHNNIVHVSAAGSSLALLEKYGNLSLRNSWLKSGWKESHDAEFEGDITLNGGLVVGADPGFVNHNQGDYHLKPDSGARDAGIALHPDLVAAHPLTRQYVTHIDHETRPVDTTLDMGAFEYILAGDVDGSTQVDLEDTRRSLKTTTNETAPVQSAADVDGDRKIGLPEAIHGLSRTLEAAP